jgi:hypothetical protein
VPAEAELIVVPLLPDPIPRVSVGIYRAVAAEVAALAQS